MIGYRSGYRVRYDNRLGLHRHRWIRFSVSPRIVTFELRDVRKSMKILSLQ